MTPDDIRDLMSVVFRVAREQPSYRELTIRDLNRAGAALKDFAELFRRVEFMLASPSGDGTRKMAVQEIMRQIREMT